MTITRRAHVAGLFYDDDALRLRQDVERMLAGPFHTTLTDPVLGIVVPHAGHMYSGSTAAAAFALPDLAACDTAFIVAPSHRASFTGVSVFDGDAYGTPLGALDVDIVLRDELLNAGPPLFPSSLGHHDEHAIEVQLPFLHCVNPGCRILPMIMGDQHRDTAMHLGDLLAGFIQRHADRRIMLIASSDLSHFHHQSKALELDNVADHAITAMDPAALLHDVNHGKTEACGAGPIAAVMHACILLGATRGVVLDRCTSGDITGDVRRVVGYLSAAFTRYIPHHAGQA